MPARPLVAVPIAIALACAGCTSTPSAGPSSTVSTPTTAEPPASTPSAVATAPPARVGLDEPGHKELAMELVSSAENSSLDWRAQYGYIEDIGDGRGYTAGIVGFCSGTSDMLELVGAYTATSPDNPLAPYLPALRAVDGSDSHEGLDPGFVPAWKQAADDPVFQAAQDRERDTVYFDPAVALAKADGLGALGQFAYYDAAVMHGFDGMQGVRSRALVEAATPAAGGDETAYLAAFLDERVVEMNKEEAHSDTSRVDDAQRVFLDAGNLELDPPLRWHVYGDAYEIAALG
ncbi:chitosanase [Cellulomonas edaphi]|uniref:Chitosanase n=1 Tax=Cellulomonas edaphi TaxID=3053468 RepID=A0ABT7S412_9CELL|nr:chitosanase [Cellulomons edaphi]MDM7830366.1 chitosanase [Cellulomons edaphi]